jgi:hypothetical protein
VDANLMRESGAVRAEVAHNLEGLSQYTWRESREVSVKGSVKSSTAFNCRYNAAGEVTRAPIVAPDDETSRAVSRRPMVRKKADMEDYIERTVRLIQYYLPPTPRQIDYQLKSGSASLGQSPDGHPQIRLTHYFQQGDSMVFTYDAASKKLLHVSVSSALGGSPKDPVTLEADFQTLPDGVNHYSSATVVAKARKVQIRMTNTLYQKLAN